VSVVGYDYEAKYARVKNIARKEEDNIQPEIL